MHRKQSRSRRPSPKPQLQSRQRTDSRDDDQGLASSLDGDEDVDSQDFSDSSSDAEGIFAFHPPTTADSEQRTAPEHHQSDKRLSTPQNYNSEPQSENVHTLVESPIPLAAALAGSSRYTSQAHVDLSIEQYRSARQNVAVPSHPDSDWYNASPLSSSVSHRKTKGDVRIAFAEAVILRERGTEKSDIVAEAGESVLGFEFDDAESRDGSKEYVPALQQIISR